MNIENILVLAPHTDDGELCLGGTISRYIEEGKNVYYAAFSTADQSVPEGFPKDILDRAGEKVGREQYLMKKANEDVFVIVEE